jgi:multidrug resistance protein, MATE family
MAFGRERKIITTIMWEELGMRRGRLRQHVVELLKLAAPVIVARAGLMVMSAVDILIVARYSSEELAYLGLGTLPASMLVTAGIGLLLGTMILTSHAVGADRIEECGRIWRQSLPYALLLGLLAALASLLGEPFFRLAGQGPDVARGGAGVFAVLGAGLPAAMLYTTSAFFLEGLRRPLPGMVVMIVANLLNIPLNLILVWGAWGIPALGAEGSAWATTIVRWMLALSLLAYVWNLNDRDRLRIREPAGQWWRGAAHQRRLGYAAGASLAMESSAFSILGLFAGMVGPLGLGAYTISLNLIALPFMMAVGLASATGVRVGVAYGRRDRHDVVVAGWTGLGVTSVILAVVACLFALFPEQIGGLFTSDPQLLAVTVPLVTFSAFILVADGGQVVMASALRAQADTWVPTVLHFFSYYGVMLPLGATLALNAGRGVVGLFEGILIASVVSITVLSLRFHLLSRA